MPPCYKCALPILLAVLSVFAADAAGQQPAAKNVLVLFSALPNKTNDAALLESLETGLRARIREPITFYQSFLTNRDATVWDPLYLKSQAETFRRTYAQTKLDLIITVAPQALNFAIEYRNEMFPGVPIVFTQVDDEEFQGRSWPPGVTGMTVPLGVRETINLAMRLHPDTETVAIISGPDHVTLSAEHDELLHYAGKVHVIDLIGPASIALLQKASALPPHTVVLFQLAPDLYSPQFGRGDLLDAVARRFPTYSAWENDCLNHECVGGAFGDRPKQDASTMEIVSRVLAGERPEDIPVVRNTDVRYTVDWRELQRWHIPESALPPGSMVLYREPTLWQRGKKYFLAAIAVIAVQTLLILGLLWQRARKKKAESVLRESERRFRVMADSTPSLIWMCDHKGQVAYLNEQWLSFTGSEPHEGYAHSWTAYIHLGDLNNVRSCLSEALKSHQPFSREYRLRRADGAYRWMFDVAAPRLNGDGSFAGFIGSAVDVTDQKLAREALETVSGRLIDAQEKERSRLARELHDDVCQRLAMISFKIKRAKGRIGGQSSIGDQLEEIWEQCSTLTGDVQALSHELHPSMLYNLGLVTAIRSFCREISEQNGVAVEVIASRIPDTLPREVSLSLFRVVQEALHNAVKYSGQKQFEVLLQGKDGELELEVSDNGIGFDAASMKNGRGLGLVSMAERIHQINGTFDIDSQPNVGTRIRARVPLTKPEIFAACPN